MIDPTLGDDLDPETLALRALIRHGSTPDEAALTLKARSLRQQRIDLGRRAGSCQRSGTGSPAWAYAERTNRRSHASVERSRSA